MMALADVLKTLAEDNSLVLFNFIALCNGDSDILISTLHLTRNQYYKRLSPLLKAGLVKREMSKYHLTTFGMIIHHVQEIIEEALNQDWKLKAIDSINIGELPQDQLHRIIDKLITNQEIKEVLIPDIKEEPYKSEGAKMASLPAATARRPSRLFSPLATISGPTARPPSQPLPLFIPDCPL